MRKCYRKECSEDCDKYKPYYCIKFMNKEQLLLKQQIKDSNICDCGAKMVKARFQGKVIKLCTRCQRQLKKIRRELVG